jgi:hypothetical protein
MSHAVEPAIVGDVPPEFKRHLLHVSERASADPSPEDGEQRSAVGEQEALLAVDPENVQIPVVVARSGLAERDFAAEKIEHLLRAPTTTQRTYQPTAPDSRSDAVLVDQPTEQSSATDIRKTCSGRSVVEPVRRCEPERPVWPVSVVVPDVNPEDTLDGVGRRSGDGRGSRRVRSLPTAPRRRSHWAPAPAS